MISQKQYVARLEKMLRVDEPCGTCPGRIRYLDAYQYDAISAWKATNDRYTIDRYICDMCLEFIGLKRNYSHCPCHSFKRPSTALRRAGRAIREYRAGMHKWCKEGK